VALICGLVGVPGSGKTTIYNAITAAGATGFGGTETNRMVVNVPDSRLDKLVSMYNPRKLVPATLDILDIPGLKKAQGSSRGSQLLANLKNVEALLHVIRCFEDPNVPFEYDTINPARDMETIDLEMMAADAATLENKIERVSKKLKAGDNKEAATEVAHCKKVFDAIQQGIPARRQNLSKAEKVSVYECNLVSLKPVLYIANVKSMADAGNKYVAALKEIAAAENAEMIVICGRDEADISQLDKADQKEFLKELGLEESSMERLLKAAYRLLGLISFFTVGEDEVRAWTCRAGDKAPVAAGKIHTDMEKGFIRMEVMHYDDLVALGSENALVKTGKKRVESREYEVKDGDIVTVLFNKP
jgi:ribosome-binding ATPase